MNESYLVIAAVVVLMIFIAVRQSRHKTISRISPLLKAWAERRGCSPLSPDEVLLALIDAGIGVDPNPKAAMSYRNYIAAGTASGNQTYAYGGFISKGGIRFACYDKLSVEGQFRGNKPEMVVEHRLCAKIACGRPGERDNRRDWALANGLNAINGVRNDAGEELIIDGRIAPSKRLSAWISDPGEYVASLEKSWADALIKLV